MENVILVIDTLIILACICLMIIVGLTRRKDTKKIINVNKKLKQYLEDLKDVKA